MQTEKEKMPAGNLYNAFNAQLTEERIRARLLISRLNNSREDRPEERAEIVKALVPPAEIHAG